MERLLGEGSLLMAFMLSSTLLCYLLYHYVNKNALLRHACIGGMVSALIAWPVVTGQSGIMLLDFWKPALGFRSCRESLPERVSRARLPSFLRWC